MADPREIDPILDELESNFGRTGWAQKVRASYHRIFGKVAITLIRDAAERFMADPDQEHPPTAAKLRALVAEVPEAVKGCGLCAAGVREMVVHRRINGEIVIVVGAVRCDCEAGETVDRGDWRNGRGRLPDLAGQVAHVERDPSVIFWRLDPGPRDLVRLDAPRPKGSDAIRAVEAWARALAGRTDPELGTEKAARREWTKRKAREGEDGDGES